MLLPSLLSNLHISTEDERKHKATVISRRPIDKYGIPKEEGVCRMFEDAYVK
jgi:hypothetical protein